MLQVIRLLRVAIILIGLAILGQALVEAQMSAPSRSSFGLVTFAPFVFANITTTLVKDGQVGFCSDCTIANPCAGGGTGALAKRLNGVQVCN